MPVPGIMEETLELIQLVPQERIQERIVEETIDVSVRRRKSVCSAGTELTNAELSTAMEHTLRGVRREVAERLQSQGGLIHSV